jgi:uncharacterized protein (DUF4213/DUF364 family)
MKPIIEALIEYALAWDSQERMADIRVGLGYTAAKLESGKAGVACMLRYRLGKGTCSLLPQAGTLAGLEVGQAISLCRSHNVVEASIGLATLNALIDWTGDVDSSNDKGSSNDELVELLHIDSHDQVGMVGHIAPVVNAIRQHTNRCVIFDEGKLGQEGITDTAQESTILSQCDVVILSATSLLNHTFDSLLLQASGAREICVMGPSTPLLPEVFRARGVTLLAGRQITDANQILRIVSEAGGTKRFGMVSKKVNIVLK